MCAHARVLMCEYACERACVCSCRARVSSLHDSVCARAVCVFACARACVCGGGGGGVRVYVCQCT